MHSLHPQGLSFFIRELGPVPTGLRASRKTNAETHEALGALRKPAPARMMTGSRPTVRQLSLRAPLHGKKSWKRKTNQSD